MRTFNKHKFMIDCVDRNQCAEDIKRYLLMWANRAHGKTEEETGLIFRDKWCDEKEDGNG